MTSGSLRHDVRRTRRGLVTAFCALPILLTASAALIVRTDAEQRAALTGRFDTRQATASHFIAAYVGEVFEREATLAGRSFAGPVTGEGFDRAATDHGFTAAVLLDADGRLLASQPNDPAVVGRDMTTYAHLRSAVSGVPAVSGVVPSAAGGDLVVGFAVPFETPSGRRVFSGAYAVEATPLAPFMRNSTPFRTAQVLLVDAGGVIIAANGTDVAGRPMATVGPELAAITSTSRLVGAGADERYVSQGPVPGTSWRMVVTVKTDELFTPLRGSGRWVPWLALLGFGLAAMLGMIMFYRYLAERARLVDSESRLRAILDTAGDAFLGMDEHGTITEWNAAATALLGWCAAEVVGRPLAELVIPPDLHEAHLAGVARFLATGQTRLPAEPVQLAAMRRDGTLVQVELTLSRMPWASGWRFHAFLRDITERVEHERRLRELALTDSLTGLANRRAALDRLDQALARARRHGTPAVVVYVDVDKFKSVNDRHGHATGDGVLVAVADRLRATFRTEDTIARFGGDEFVVVCEDLHAPDDAHVLAARTRSTLAEPYLVAGHRLNLSASVGLAVSDGHATVEHVLDRADAQMYEAKTTRQAFTDIVENVE